MNKIPFIRFGGLSPVKQKGYDASMPSFHSPPARRGIYAFPESKIEKFLLGSSVFDQRRHVKVSSKKVKKDKDGYPLAMTVWKNEELYKRFIDVLDCEDYDLSDDIYDELRNDGQILVKHCKPKKFYHTGDLWHHLEVSPKDVLLKKGSWVLTSYEVWQKAFHKEVKLNKLQKVRCGYGTTKDGYEVFIENMKG